MFTYEQLSKMKRDYYQVGATSIMGLTARELEFIKVQGYEVGHASNPGKKGHVEVTVKSQVVVNELKRLLSQSSHGFIEMSL